MLLVYEKRNINRFRAGGCHVEESSCAIVAQQGDEVCFALPLHGVVSKKIMLLTFTGRKSEKNLYDSGQLHAAR